MSCGVLTVVLPASAPGSKVAARGTKVLMPDGTRLPGVRNVEVLSHFNGAVMARIEVFCRVEVRTPDEQDKFVSSQVD